MHLKAFHVFPKPITFVLLAFSIFLFSCKSGNEKTDPKADSIAAKKKADSIFVANGGFISAPFHYDPSKRYIYLTWDDGPQPPGTSTCMKVFKDLGVKATFFMVGMHGFDSYRMSLVDSVRNSYPQFLLANHSYSHAFRDHYATFYTHPDSAIADFMKVQDMYKIPVKIIRLPGNSAWVNDHEVKSAKSVRNVCNMLDSLGYNVMGWDIEWRFKNQGGSVPVQSVDQLLKEVNDAYDNRIAVNTPNNVVILAHDRMFAKPNYTDSLIKFVSTLKKDPRYVFETLDHYPGLKNIQKSK
ncbi:MAG: polysaccharide deacetylase family protein [Bacteroidetes bacterium]|nr:polysaccharide deacetylase family protein [Bacteroidota bacterium]